MEDNRIGFNSLKKEISGNNTDKDFLWILERAKMYSEFCGVSVDDVLNSWERHRKGYWRNFYNEYNMPDVSKKKVLKHSKWVKKGKKLYGNDFSKWKFKCPFCGRVQTVEEFVEHGGKPDYAYKKCFSSFEFAQKRKCDGYASKRIGKVYRVIDNDYICRTVFPFADNIRKRKKENQVEQ